MYSDAFSVAAADLVLRTTSRQGLPVSVDDECAIQKVAALVASCLDCGTSDVANGSGCEPPCSQRRDGAADAPQ